MSSRKMKTGASSSHKRTRSSGMKFNSTGTFTADYTLVRPNIHDLFCTVSIVLQCQIVEGHNESTLPNAMDQILSDDLYWGLDEKEESGGDKREAAKEARSDTDEMEKRDGAGGALAAASSSSSISSSSSSSSSDSSVKGRKRRSCSTSSSGGQRSGKRQKLQPPTVNDVFNFLIRLYKSFPFSPQVAIATLIYVNRIMTLATVPLTYSNWRYVNICRVVTR